MSRPFVPVEASERSRLGLKANLADCRRIREVWLARKAENDNRDAGYSAARAAQCTNELRAIAEEEAATSLDLLGRAVVAMKTAVPIVKEFRDCIVDCEAVGGDLATLGEKTRGEVAAHDGVVALIEEINAAVDAANQE